MDFSIRLKHLRHKHKLTQGDLATVLGLKSTAISNYESKRNEPSFDKLIALSNYFNVSCDYLLGLCDTKIRMGSYNCDRELLELYELCQNLNQENKNEARNFMEYLLYKQEMTINYDE